MNIFDGLQETAFAIVNNTMGYVASWELSEDSVLTAKVLFKDATETAKILDQVYSPKNCMIEYKSGDFTGLKELTDGGSEQIIIVNGLQYGVMEVRSKYDGKTLYAHLKQL